MSYTPPDQVQGKAATGAALSGNPVLVAGSDGANARNVNTDASGHLQTNVLAITAGETHLGSVGGDGDVLTVTPSLNVAGVYATGDLVGQKNTVASAVRVSGGRGVILSVILADKAKQASALDLVFFNADPTGTTFTDNGAFTIADADLLKIIGHVSITAADYSSFVDNCVATKAAVGLMFKASVSTIYMAVVSRGTPTYVAADLQVLLNIAWD